MVFLVHDLLGAQLAGAAEVAEADMLAVELVAAEPVVAAGIAVDAVRAEGQGNRVAADHRIVADPLGDVGDVVLQQHGLGRAAGEAEDHDRGQEARGHA